MGQPATDLATDWWLAAALGVLDDHVYFGLLGVDRTYQELFVGPNLDRLLGGPAQVPGLWRSRIDPRDRPAYYAVEAELLAGRPAQVDYRVHGLDGVTRWIRARVNPEALADGSVRFAGILSDITHQRQADDDLRAALADLAEANAKLDAAHTRALELAKTDPLTGAANRRHVDDVLSVVLATEGQAVGVLLLDIDDFKVVNDRHGHRVGDEVLVEIVARLERAVRPEDVVARWGGEEFLLVCRSHEQESIRAVAERIRTAVSRAAVPHDRRRAPDHDLDRRGRESRARAIRGPADRRRRCRAARGQAHRQEPDRDRAPAARHAAGRLSQAQAAAT